MFANIWLPSTVDFGPIFECSSNRGKYYFDHLHHSVTDPVFLSGWLLLYPERELCEKQDWNKCVFLLSSLFDHFLRLGLLCCIFYCFFYPKHFLNKKRLDQFIVFICIIICKVLFLSVILWYFSMYFHCFLLHTLEYNLKSTSYSTTLI